MRVRLGHWVSAGGLATKRSMESKDAKRGRWRVPFVTVELPEATRHRSPAAARFMEQELGDSPH